jgi:hypothetical protein
MKPRPSLTLCVLLAMTGGQSIAAEPKPAPANDDVITVELQAVESVESRPAGPGEFNIRLAPGVPGEQPRPFIVPVPGPDSGAATPGRRVLFHINPAGPVAQRLPLPPKALFLTEPGQGKDVIFRVATGPMEMKKVAYLGVSTSPVSAQLASHLKLPAGFGLIVDHAQPGEPADKAGLKTHDVIVRFGDQKLVNAMQLGTLVRAQKPGDEIELTVIREGKETTVKAKLVEKEMPAATLGEGMPMGALGFGPLESIEAGQLAWDDAVATLPAAPGTPGAPGVSGVVGRAAPGATTGSGMRYETVMRYSDDEHQLEILPGKEGRKLVVKGKDGKVIFDGPINTDEQRKAVPEALRTKLEKLEKSTVNRLPLTPLSRSARIERTVEAVPLEGFDLEAYKALDGEAIKSMLDEHFKDLKLEGAQQEQLRKQLDEMKKRIDEMTKQLREKHGAIAPGGAGGVAGGPAVNAFRFQRAAAVASLSDDEHQITIKSDGQSTHLTVKDKDGKEIFAGPINTDEELAKVPAEVRAKLKQLETSSRLRVRLNRPGGAGAPEPRERADKEDDK